MAVKIQRRIAVKVLGACGLLTIFFLVLHLNGPGLATHRDIFTPFWRPPAVSVDPVRPQQPQSKTPQSSDTIPKKLWYKLGPAGLRDDLKAHVETCIKNPGYAVQFFTDESGDAFVKESFSWNPNLVDKYLAITIPIVKADLLRYLILYEYGGIWNDLDVSCEAPIDEWIPEKYKSSANIVVGLEFDVSDWIRQLASWTILAKPKQRHFIEAVEGCLDELVTTAKKRKVKISDLKRDMINDIVDVSGPRRLTRAILATLSKKLNKNIGNDDIANVTEPRLVGDVLILPDVSFADHMNQYYGDKKPGRILVEHHYAGSWKNRKGGE